MKATFVFDMNDPEDMMDHKRMSNALGMSLVLWEIKINVNDEYEEGMFYLFYKPDLEPE